LLSALASLLMSGVDAFQAFERAARLTRNPVLRAAYQRGEAQLKLGASVADALLKANVLTADEGYPLVSTGEMAGRLNQSLLDQRGRDNAALESGLESAATWLPRVVYVLALGTVAGSIGS
jgi:type II secretory pathway component PulF